ncbi:hypothetical protein TW86_03590 [Halomonas sp. S2151]|nr:hypothetical protein TW86_03590 [Halomonas sp. S2151]
MLGCKGSAVVFSPESSTCVSCPHNGGCSETALLTTKAKRRNAEAVFLSAKFATTAVSEDDMTVIQLSDASDRIKRHAMALSRKGFRFESARQQLDQGVNPFRHITTTVAFVTVYDALLEQSAVRKRDIIARVMERMQCSQSTASGHVSDALGLGQLMRVVTVTRYTASLTTEVTQ